MTLNNNINNSENQDLVGERESVDAVKNDGLKQDEMEDMTVINVNTRIKYKTIYKKCGHIEERESKPSVDLLGLDYEKAVNRFLDWNIETFTKEEVVLIAEVNGFDKDCLENSYLGIKDGAVAVFYGKPGEGKVVKKQTNILVANLPQSEIADLEKGIIINSEEELYEILEGLSNLE
jgi:hypothetical protein